jgi:hypothetical protein
MVEENHKAGQNPPRVVASPEEEDYFDRAPTVFTLTVQ